MSTFDRAEWKLQFGVPLLILLIPILVSVLTMGDVMLLLIPVALAIGWVLRPHQLWPLWLGSVLIIWIISGLGELFNLPDEPGAVEETFWSFAIESFIFMAVLVLLPLWIGRLLRKLFTQRHLGART